MSELECQEGIAVPVVDPVAPTIEASKRIGYSAGYLLP